MYPREMGVEACANGFISINRTFTKSIYREEKNRVKGKGGGKGHGMLEQVMECCEKEQSPTLQHFSTGLPNATCLKPPAEGR
jgi:hypothetical protein